jgi:redox-sensitive bicupin YhaK (pirin superfamily)
METQATTVASPRPVIATWKSQPTIEGAGVHLKRAVGNGQVIDLDPFLLLDDFRSDSPELYLPGFPWHPHRGMETITYVLDGDVEHEDSLGNGGVIRSGDVQWMTAGSGIIHQEMPKGDRQGHMYGFQLWANLPARQKMMDPRYRDVRQKQIPEVRMDSGAMVRVICGEAAGVAGPVQDIVTEPQYLDVALAPGTRFTHHVPQGHTAFAYVIDGEGYFGPGPDVGGGALERSDNGSVVVYSREGDTVSVSAEAKPVRFLLISGKPLGEPVAWYGPIVMNTQSELRTAFEDLRKGTFLKHVGD